MAFESHKSITEPNDDKKIWRYFSTSQFLSALQDRSLHLSRLDQFDDPFEGYSPVKNLKEEITAKKQEGDQFENLPIDPNTADPETRVKRGYESVRRMSLANCWSMREEDSLPMWKSYIPDGDGVAVCTTFGKLRESINSCSDVSYHAGKVVYFDYFDYLKESDNFFNFIMSKPRQYNYEKELRILVWWPDSGEVTLDNPEPGDTIPHDSLKAPIGTKIDVNMDMLIDKLYVSPFGPPWLTSEYCNNLLDKYEIEATAEMSQLAMEPEDVLNYG